MVSRNRGRSRGGDAPGYQLKLLSPSRNARSSAPSAIRATRQTSGLMELVVVGIELIGAIVPRLLRCIAFAAPALTWAGTGLLLHEWTLLLGGPTETVFPRPGFRRSPGETACVRKRGRGQPGSVVHSPRPVQSQSVLASLPPPTTRHPFANVKGGREHQESWRTNTHPSSQGSLLPFAFRRQRPSTFPENQHHFPGFIAAFVNPGMVYIQSRSCRPTGWRCQQHTTPHSRRQQSG